LLCTDFPALALSLAASPSPLLQGAGKPIYKYFSPNPSKIQHPEAWDKCRLARNPMDYVCKAQQLTDIRNLSPSYP